MLGLAGEDPQPYGADPHEAQYTTRKTRAQGLGSARFLGWCWMVLEFQDMNTNVFVVLVLFD
jgi:hypothetical protein